MAPVPGPASPVVRALEARAARTRDRDELGRAAVGAIHAALPQALWTGIYWLDGGILRLGPFLGPPTDHVHIPVGVGVCGTAVAEGRDQVVDDVRTRANYLACSLRTRSEIVVLIRAGGAPGGAILGQLDLDSESVGAFPPADHAFLTDVATSLGRLLG
jgi:GAF domain-containing protein